jgi:hypothetical protein
MIIGQSGESIGRWNCADRQVQSQLIEKELSWVKTSTVFFFEDRDTHEYDWCFPCILQESTVKCSTNRKCSRISCERITILMIPSQRALSNAYSTSVSAITIMDRYISQDGTMWNEWNKWTYLKIQKTATAGCAMWFGCSTTASGSFRCLGGLTSTASGAATTDAALSVSSTVVFGWQVQHGNMKLSPVALHTISTIGRTTPNGQTIPLEDGQNTGQVPKFRRSPDLHCRERFCCQNQVTRPSQDCQFRTTRPWSHRNEHHHW